MRVRKYEDDANDEIVLLIGVSIITTISFVLFALMGA